MLPPAASLQLWQVPPACLRPTYAPFPFPTPCSIFLPYPPGTNASTIYQSPEFSFRYTPDAPFDCPTCTNATHYLWGLSTNVINWQVLKRLSPLPSLSSKGYK